jgi:hypothetical protein
MKQKVRGDEGPKLNGIWSDALSPRWKAGVYVQIRDFLGHSQIASTGRYAKVSSRKIKQEDLRTMQKILKQGQGSCTRPLRIMVIAPSRAVCAL